MFIYSTITKPRSPLRRMSDKKRSSMEKLAEIRKQKVEKFGRACQVKTPDCRGGREQGLHHLKKRRGPSDDTPENTVLSCNACNGYIEDHPEWALKHGFTRRSWE